MDKKPYRMERTMDCGQREVTDDEHGRFCEVCLRSVANEVYVTEPSREVYGVIDGRSVTIRSPFPKGSAARISINFGLSVSTDDIVVTLWSACHDTELIATRDAYSVDAEVLEILLHTGCDVVDDAMADIKNLRRSHVRLDELIQCVSAVYSGTLSQEILAAAGGVDFPPLSVMDIAGVI